MLKEHRGHVIKSWIPGIGRMLPHSGQKFISPLKQDIPLISKRNTSTGLNRVNDVPRDSEQWQQQHTCTQARAGKLIPTAQQLFWTFNNGNISLTGRCNVVRTDNKYNSKHARIRNAFTSLIFSQAPHRTIAVFGAFDMFVARKWRQWRRASRWSGIHVLNCCTE